MVYYGKYYLIEVNLMDCSKYIEIERGWLGDWPKKTEGFDYRQTSDDLALEALETVRSNSCLEGLSLKDYEIRIKRFREIFDGLRYSLNDTHRTESDKRINEQSFWNHKKTIETVSDESEATWPISRGGLEEVILDYLKTPYMQTQSLNYLLTDALVYAELADYKNQSVARSKLPWIASAKPSVIGRFAWMLTKWAVLVSALIFTYEESGFVFLLLGMSIIAYQSIKSLKPNNLDLEGHLYRKLTFVYIHLEPRFYNPKVTWELCYEARKEGIVFSGALYDLLELQINSSTKRYLKSYEI
jgi:hypothetical protein